MKAVTDEQLIRWVADGDPSCLGTLFERHHRGVYRFFLHMLRNPAVAEDLTQEVFLKMLKKANSFRGEGTFRAWMFSIARNVAYEHLRRHKLRQTEALDEAGMEGLADQHSAEDSAAGRQQVALVMQAIARLPDAMREVILLGRFEFDSYEELGQALDCSAGTARVRMHRAMKQLTTSFQTAHGVTIDG